MKRTIYLLPILLIIGCTIEKHITGTVDDTDTGVVAEMLFEPDGEPADSATIKVFEIGGTTVAFETVTDSAGNYSLVGLDGTYNIWAEKDSLFAFQDSVFVFPDTQYVRNDTLSLPGSVTAKVGLEPGDDYRTVTVNVLGTPIHSNVDSDGWFTLDDMPEGEYNLRLTTTLPNYTTTFYQLDVYSESSDSLKDTLWLIYTGIPLVLGIEADYDTLNGVMELTWKEIDYANFQEFLIYRQEDTAKNPSTIPIGIIDEHTFLDTIYGDDETRFLDTSSYTFQYRVKIRNKFDEEGKIYGYIKADAVPPSLVKTETTFKLAKGESDTITINDTINIITSLKNPTRKLEKLSFAVEDEDSVVQAAKLGSKKKTATDTLKYSWSKEGTYTVYAIAEDVAGDTWIDSTIVQVIEDLPVADAGKDTLVLTNTDINLRGKGTDRLGEIVKYEWAFGSQKNFHKTSKGDTTVKAPNGETDSYKCFLRVTDDDGKSDVDTISISLKKFVVVNPKANGTISGVYSVTGFADPTVAEVRVRFANGSWTIAKGVKSWSANIETRLLFPKTSSTISVKTVEDGKTTSSQTISTNLSNTDPIIDCWGRTANDSYPECFYQGSCDVSDWISGFSSSWYRTNENEIIIRSSRGTYSITVKFKDYNTMVVSDASYNNGTYLRQ